MSSTVGRAGVLGRLACSYADQYQVELFPSLYHTIEMEDEPLRWEVPAFKIGGWIATPDRWWNDHTDFAELADGATIIA